MNALTLFSSRAHYREFSSEVSLICHNFPLNALILKGFARPFAYTLPALLPTFGFTLSRLTRFSCSIG